MWDQMEKDGPKFIVRLAEDAVGLIICTTVIACLHKNRKKGLR